MRKLSLRLILALFVLVHADCFLIPAQNRTQGAKVLAAEIRSLSAETHSFLTKWLIERTVEQAMLFFAESAFENEFMLSAPCAGYVNPGDRRSGELMREAVRRFLLDFLADGRKRSLFEVLNTSAAIELAAQLDERVGNNPRQDSFVVARLRLEDLPAEGSAELEYLSRSVPGAILYASFVPIGDGMIYFLWVRQDGSWKIYHASLVCN